MELERVRTVTADAWQATVDLLDGRTEHDLDRSTRLAGWTVRDLVAHVLWGTTMEAEALDHARVGDPSPAAGRHHDVSAAEAATALAAARAELLDRLDALAADVEAAGDAATRTVPLAAGTFPYALVLDVVAMEAAVHADDLAAAFDAPSSLDPDGVAASIAVAAWLLPALADGAEDVPDGPRTIVVGEGPAFVFAPGEGWSATPVDARVRDVADVIVDGDGADVVRWLYGRAPFDVAALTVRGDADVAAAAKRWLPGP